MSETLRIIFAVCAILMTIFGWNVSRAGVYLVWCLLCIEEIVYLQVRARKKGRFAPAWVKPVLFGACGVFLVLALVSIL